MPVAVDKYTLDFDCGSTVTYGELARRIGRPKAARAIGQAMRRNRLPIIIPCHRVLPKDGKLGKNFGAKGFSDKGMGAMGAMGGKGMGGMGFHSAGKMPRMKGGKPGYGFDKGAPPFKKQRVF